MSTLPNPFLNSAVINPRTAGSAVASSDLQPRTTAAPIQSSDGGVQESPASIPDYNGVKSPALVTAHGLSGKSCPLSRREAGPSEAIPSNEGRPSEAPASAPPKNPDAGVLDATDCIHEIFHWVRKLMRGHQGFVLDEPAFMADVEEEPLFLRSGDHLRRWEA